MFSLFDNVNNAISLQPNERKEPMLSTFLCKPISTNPIEGSEDNKPLHLGSVPPLTEINTEEVQACRSEVPVKRSDNCKETIKFGHSRAGRSLGISALGEQCQQYEDQYKKVDRAKPSVLVCHVYS